MPDAMSHLLVPTDFGPASQQATRLALEMAFGSRARVTLLHVIPEEPLVGLDAIGYLHRVLTPDSSGRCAWSHPDAEPCYRTVLDRLEREVHPEWRQSVTIRTAVRRGDVAVEVTRYAREDEPDLIVIGVNKSGWRFSLRPRLSEQIRWGVGRPAVLVHPDPGCARPSLKPLAVPA